MTMQEEASQDQKSKTNQETKSSTTQCSEDDKCEFCGIKITTDERNYFGSCRDKECRSKFNLKEVKSRLATPERRMLAGVPKRFSKVSSISSLRKSAGDKIPVNVFNEDNELSVGMYLWGDVGVGKTTIAASLFNGSLEKIIKETRSTSGYREYGIDAKWTTVSMMLLTIRESFMDKSKMSELDVVNSYLGYDVLVMDDLGAEKGTEWTWQTISTIVDERINKGKCTIITSNLSPKDVNEIDKRLSSRIMGLHVVRVDGQDLRAIHTKTSMAVMEFDEDLSHGRPQA